MGEKQMLGVNMNKTAFLSVHMCGTPVVQR